MNIVSSKLCRVLCLAEVEHSSATHPPPPPHSLPPHQVPLYWVVVISVDTAVQLLQCGGYTSPTPPPHSVLSNIYSSVLVSRVCELGAVTISWSSRLLHCCSERWLSDGAADYESEHKLWDILYFSSLSARVSVCRIVVTYSRHWLTLSRYCSMSDSTILTILDTALHCHNCPSSHYFRI